VEHMDRQFFSTGNAGLTNARRRAMQHQVKQGDGYAQMHMGAIAHASVNDRGEALSISGVQQARIAGAAYKGNAAKKQHKKKKAGKQRSGQGVYEY
ncbi:hypothetical protein EC988_005530, partial [Linderina pennispora]